MRLEGQRKLKVVLPEGLPNLDQLTPTGVNLPAFGGWLCRDKTGRSQGRKVESKQSDVL
jgi:hypothetical protein